MRVPFADTDLAGIVHFSNFFRYMENAEHAFYRSLGFSVHGKGSAAKELECFPGLMWPRVAVSCDYKRPLHFEEEVAIRMYLTAKRERSLGYGFYFHTDAWEEAIAIGKMTVVCAQFDVEKNAMQAVAIPEAIGQKIEAVLS